MAFPIGTEVCSATITGCVSGCAERGVFTATRCTLIDGTTYEQRLWVTLAVEARLDLGQLPPPLAAAAGMLGAGASRIVGTAWLTHQARRYAAMLEECPRGVPSVQLTASLDVAARGLARWIGRPDRHPMGGIRPETVFVCRSSEYRPAQYVVDPDWWDFTGVVPYGTEFSSYAHSPCLSLPPLYPVLHFAPERLRGERPTLASDLYETAFTLQRWFGAERPYDSDAPSDQFRQALAGVRRPLRGPYAALNDALDAAMALDPRDRSRPIDFARAVCDALPLP